MATNLISRVDSAFDGTDPLVPMKLDYDPCHDVELAENMKYFVNRRREEVTVEGVLSNFDALHFLSAQALRYYLPEFLKIWVGHPFLQDAQGIYCYYTFLQKLCPVYLPRIGSKRQLRLEIRPHLTLPQLSVIAEVLYYLWPIYHLHEIDHFWSEADYIESLIVKLVGSFASLEEKGHIDSVPSVDF